MSVQIGEITTTVEVAPSASTTTGSLGSREETPAMREHARRIAERAARIAQRTRAEGYDD